MVPALLALAAAEGVYRVEATTVFASFSPTGEESFHVPRSFQTLEFAR